MLVSISTYQPMPTQKTCIELVEGIGDFGQFLKMRNFCNQKFNLKSYRDLTLTPIDNLSSRKKGWWLQEYHEQLLDVSNFAVISLTGK
jgi:hypothetical protein